jgi:hypothetical protein
MNDQEKYNLPKEMRVVVIGGVGLILNPFKSKTKYYQEYAPGFIGECISREDHEKKQDIYFWSWDH